MRPRGDASCDGRLFSRRAGSARRAAPVAADGAFSLCFQRFSLCSDERHALPLPTRATPRPPASPQDGDAKAVQRAPCAKGDGTAEVRGGSPWVVID